MFYYHQHHLSSQDLSEGFFFLEKKNVCQCFLAVAPVRIFDLTFERSYDSYKTIEGLVGRHVCTMTCELELPLADNFSGWQLAVIKSD